MEALMTANARPDTSSPIGELHKVDLPIDQFGPCYKVMGQGLARHRKLAGDGLRRLSREERVAYADAVELAVLALQRQELRRAAPAEQRPNCASGSWDEYPSEAVRRQQHAALASWPAKVRRNRTDVEWKALYEEAMEAKAAAIADRLLAGGNIWEIAA